ncbi:MAG: hypothetical protein NE330_11520 [Lentisphaeraceae bacterium]|nr:hypothetical protein [Lentisphaeraceae bacterium]
MNYQYFLVLFLSIFTLNNINAQNYVRSQLPIILDEPLLKVTRTTVYDDWSSIDISNYGFSDPVIILGTFGDRNDDFTIKVRNVSADDFEVKIQEFSYQDQIHDEIDVDLFIIERGHYLLENGKHIIADSVNLTNSQLRTVDFGTRFDEKPVVLANVVSDNDHAAAVTRIRRVNKRNFKLRLREEEGEDQIHSEERVDYLVIEEGGIDINGNSIIVSSIPRVNHTNTNTQEILFGSLFAGMQTERGKDTSWVSKAASTNDVFVNEEQSRDNEQRHIYEIVAYMTIMPRIDFNPTPPIIQDPGNGGIITGPSDGIGGGIDLGDGDDGIDFSDGNFPPTPIIGGGRNTIQLTPEVTPSIDDSVIIMDTSQDILNDYTFSDDQTEYVVEGHLSDGAIVYLYVKLGTSETISIDSQNYVVFTENDNSFNFLISLFDELTDLGFHDVEFIKVISGE